MLVQVEQLNLVFGLFGLAKAKNQPKKVLQGCNEVKKVEIFEWFYSKILPVPCGTFSPIYRVRRERLLKV
ncbi:hypothetical protein COM95_24120 [Bacillus cereus]|nr:hypothetical protein COM95_24120 [Bacillus cereus]PFH69089.1 hypothetical protein COI61_27800 [Bacillus cereus]